MTWPIEELRHMPFIQVFLPTYLPTYTGSFLYGLVYRRNFSDKRTSLIDHNMALRLKDRAASWKLELLALAPRGKIITSERRYSCL
ncbi:hypothetical protein L873DRAFT_1812924 [Choiromyces venosus 120613-1]|uniref:Uncharacterized protein n=1 Tax=Choiromyces venosus 120613-1 TaxID=1336337 RepID=A0A3N4JB10_9PEZI|nr:hypothetical protein L873DRAFT_1812924 [Choiromyces venosus 120613-1]